MLTEDMPLAIFMEGNLGSLDGKMGYGVLRFSPNPVACVIDSTKAGKYVSDVIEMPRDCPVVSTVEEAVALGARVLLLGIAPSGGRIPESWWTTLEQAVEHDMCIVNGLHDRLNDRFQHKLKPSQWIWDIRQVEGAPPMADASAAKLSNKRLLLVGTDMAIGKMTAGLEIYRLLQAQNCSSAFLATGQIGITITGKGFPLDAVKVDHACGWVQQMVLEHAHQDVVVIEGQGSLLHPASTATLALMRGACPTHLILCHKSGLSSLESHPDVRMPPLRDVISLNEAVCAAAGALTPAKTIGVSVNTSALPQAQAREELISIQDDLGIPVTDCVRFGAQALAQAVVDSTC